MSYIYLQEQEEGSWAECCSDTPPFALLKSKNTQGASSSSGNVTESSQNSLSGTMCVRSTENHGEERLMSYVEDSLAKTSAVLAQGLDLLENALAYGESMRESLAKYGLSLCLRKTHQISGHADLMLCCETLPFWGMMQSGVFWGLGTLKHLTPEKECGYSLPTPCKYGNGGTEATRKWASLGVKRTKLSPNHQEWLMGWPQGWTDLTPQATGKYLMWPNWLGN